MKQFLSIYFVLLFSLSTSTIFCQFAFERYALVSVNMIDVEAGTILKDQAIVISDGKIEQIINAANYEPNDSTQTIRLNRKYVIPGLIDTHVHLATDPSKERRDNAEKILEEMLRSGITAVRDMAGDARALADLSRDTRVGDIDGPDIYYSALMAGPEFFSDPRTIATAQGGVSGQMPYMRAVTPETDIAQVVAEATGTGAHGIKLYANLSGELMTAIVKEATSQDMPVWAHAALPPTKPSEAVASGLISVSHSSMLVFEEYHHRDSVPRAWIDQDSLDDRAFWDTEYARFDFSKIYEQMRLNNVILDATLSVFHEFYHGHPKHHWKFEFCKRITRDAHAAGVKICAGTDTDQTTFVQEEMKLLVEECGLSPLDAIIAATRHAAEATAILATDGTIEQGKNANLVILSSNPLEIINNIDDVFLVLKRGKLYNTK